MTNWKTTLAGTFAGSTVIFSTVQTALLNHTPVNWGAVLFGIFVVAMGVWAADAKKSAPAEKTAETDVVAKNAPLLLLVACCWGLLVANACSMFGPPTVKQDKICEQLDFGSDRTVEVCAPLSDLQKLRAFAAERKATLAKKVE